VFLVAADAMDGAGDPERQQALEQYKNKLLESREWEAKLKELRMDIKGLQKDFETTEDNIKALQSVGQIIGEVLKQLDEERCRFIHMKRVQRADICQSS
jgi:ATP-dependent 26S proteasome regulatory subunit